MSIGLTPYLRFAGDARAAMEFYNSVFGGELSMMTFKEGMNDDRPATTDQIMHSSLFVSRGVHLMASDTPPEMNLMPNGTVSFSSDGTDDADSVPLQKWWDGLSAGARIDVPLATAPWGDSFGQLTDKFGVTWMFNISAVRT